MVAEPPESTLTPHRIESQPPPPGPVMVKPLIVTFCAPATVTIALFPLITAGAWIIAARGFSDLKIRSFLAAGIVTCSTYVPAQTTMSLPGEAAVTAACIVGYCAPL